MTTSTSTFTFEPGQIVYASLICAHSDFPVRVTRRTAKSIWVEAVGLPDAMYPPKRCAIRSFGDSETARAWGWHLAAYSTKPNGCDPRSI